MYTNFPNGITSFGVPIFGGGNLMRSTGYGRTWFVKAIADGPYPGSDGNGGTEPDNAFLTMERAFESIDSGDVINFIGNVREQVTAPAGVFDVTINGCANALRNADAVTDEQAQTSATWRAPASPVAATPLLTLQQQGWLLNNFLVNPPSDAAGVLLTRDAGVGADERDASHAIFNHMRFAGGATGIQDSGGCFSVKVQDVIFQAITSGILNNATPVAVPLMWDIGMCRFLQNTNDIRMSSSYGLIHHNFFHTLSTVMINTVFVTAQGGNNIVAWNVFNAAEAQIAPAVFDGAASDVWTGNLVNDQAAFAFGDPA